jgi:hypothetical protein
MRTVVVLFPRITQLCDAAQKSNGGLGGLCSSAHYTGNTTLLLGIC